VSGFFIAGKLEQSITGQGPAKDLSCGKNNFCYDCAVFRQLADYTLALRIYAVKSGV
jgi:hypothetical protein